MHTRSQGHRPVVRDVTDPCVGIGSYQDLRSKRRDPSTYCASKRTSSRRPRYGRGFALVCGGGACEFEPREGVGPDVPPGPEGWGFEPTPFRTDIPEADEICNLCRQSDAKYGKGDIPSKTRWDR